VKLELISIQGYKYTTPIPLGICTAEQRDAMRREAPSDGLMIEMRGESGEIYRFKAIFTDSVKTEDVLRRTADEIASTRRRRPRPKYKVKSLLPAGHKFQKRKPQGF
jgi:hypothetical protein